MSTNEENGVGGNRNLSSSHILNIPNIGTSTSSTAGPSSSSQAAHNTSGESLLTDEEGEVNGYGNSSANGTPNKEGKLTLTALLEEGLVEPGVGVMSIDYLGQTFKGDLLACGKIKSQETGLIFNNPSAWAISCKKIINPAKKSGCGKCNHCPYPARQQCTTYGTFIHNVFVQAGHRSSTRVARWTTSKRYGRKTKPTADRLRPALRRLRQASLTGHQGTASMATGVALSLASW